MAAIEANKETLIAGGPFVLPLAHKHKVKILPADSEHFCYIPGIACVLQVLPTNDRTKI